MTGGRDQPNSTSTPWHTADGTRKIESPDGPTRSTENSRDARVSLLHAAKRMEASVAFHEEASNQDDR